MRQKIVYLFLLIALFFSVVDVYAADEMYKVNTLIPVNTKVSVETDKFDYNGMIYNTKLDSKGNASITFDGIQNNTLSKTAVSINVLLFDEAQKNIGFLTYCTDKDINTDNSGFKIRPNQVVPFTIPVTKTYFVEGKLPKDVRYIAVRDENRYCQIGGYSNYKGLTIEEITNGVEVETKKFEFPDFSSLINMSLVIIFFAVIAGIGILIGIVKLIQYLMHRKPVEKVVKPTKINTSVKVEENSEADKPIDLNSFYSNTDSLNSVELPSEKKEPVEEKHNNKSIEDLYKEAAPVSPIDQSTQATPIDTYTSISELPIEDSKPKEENTASIDDLYNSINGSNSSDDDKSGVSIDDLYESINVDDEDDDDNNSE